LKVVKAIIIIISADVSIKNLGILLSTSGAFPFRYLFRKELFKKCCLTKDCSGSSGVRRRGGLYKHCLNTLVNPSVNHLDDVSIWLIDGRLTYFYQ